MTAGSAPITPRNNATRSPQRYIRGDAVVVEHAEVCSCGASNPSHAKFCIGCGKARTV